MRWTEAELGTYQNMRQDRSKFAVEQFKVKSGVRVQVFDQDLIKTKLEPDFDDSNNVILDCEIAMVPPSVNHYWETAKKKRYLSDSAKRFHRVVGMIVPAHRSTSRLKLDVTFHFPDLFRRDIDNYLKATLDSLVKCGLCVDDEQFDELIVKRGCIMNGGLIKLRVTEISHGTKS